MDKIKKLMQELINEGIKIERDFYKRQIKGLILILQQNDSDKNFMVARTYVIQKLNMILNGGIGFHSSILEKLDE